MNLKEICLKNIEKYNKDKTSILESLSKQIIELLEKGLLESSKIGKPRYCMPIKFDYTEQQIKFIDNEYVLFASQPIVTKLLRMMRLHFNKQDIDLRVNSCAKSNWFKVSLDKE